MTTILAAAMALAMSTGAGAVTVGETATSNPGEACAAIKESIFLVQTASGGASFTVPAGGGVVTSWSTSFGAPGSPLTMVIYRPTATTNVYQIAGADTETLPTPIPASHVSTFALASPIATQAGDILGVQFQGETKAACFVHTASKSDVVKDGLAGVATPGALYTAISEAPEIRSNVSVELVQSLDLGLSETVTPSPSPAGIALIKLTASNTGAGPEPATVTDVVPSALPVLATGVSGEGTCSAAGQSVTCQLSEVRPGESPSAEIVVATSAPGGYTNQALIAGAVSDPNPANNVASATINVPQPVLAPTLSCTVIGLAKTPLNVAKAALTALHCGVGTVRKAASKTVAKGLVVGTSPKAGTVAAAGTPVSITVSSGKPKKKHKHKHKHH
jgi:hypothetical protein